MTAIHSVLCVRWLYDSVGAARSSWHTAQLALKTSELLVKTHEALVLGEKVEGAL
jgi:hypothetical protein